MLCENAATEKPLRLPTVTVLVVGSSSLSAGAERRRKDISTTDSTPVHVLPAR